MANYHLLQSKEHSDEDEETGNGTPSPATTEYDESKPLKYIAIFLAVCAITVTSFIAGCQFNSQLLLNGAAFTEDLSFLSTFSHRTDHLCEIVSDGDPPPFYLGPPGHITKTFTKDPRFRQPPSPESNEAWLSTLPSTYVHSILLTHHSVPPTPKTRCIECESDKLTLCPTDGLGIIRHPSLLGTDEPVSLAFVHQLHCLVRFSLFSPLLGPVRPLAFRTVVMNRMNE